MTEMYGLRARETIRATAPDRFRNHGNGARPRDAPRIGRPAAVETGGSVPLRRDAHACLWRQRAFSLLRLLAPLAGSGKIPRFLEWVGAPRGTDACGRPQTGTASKQSAASSGSAFLSA
jgi:hypothetical protein